MSHSRSDDDDGEEGEDWTRELNSYTHRHLHTDASVPTILFDRFYNSDDDVPAQDPYHSIVNSESVHSDCRDVESAGKRIDYMMQFLDGKISSVADDHDDSRENRFLPEFIGSGGVSGNFRPPSRADVSTSRPPCLELRPRPLRETQVGCFLRTMASTESQLWVGQESGVRFWKFSDIYGAGCGIKSGDEDTSPFSESGYTSPTLCLAIDSGNRLVWSGHKDGKIRSWKMDQTMYGSQLKDNLSWQAHRGPVFSIVITSYGDLWSASEGGSIKVWPWESIERFLSFTLDERHMAALLVEKSYIDLRSQVTLNGVCSMFASDVRHLLLDISRAKVWSAGHLSFALWDARTMELLKVFNVDGQIENGVDMLSGQEPALEDDLKIKFPSSKKEKLQGSIGFFQRSRNAIMGAADAVRRVAGKGTFGDDSRKTEALISTVDGKIWTGCTSGLLVVWDGSGARIHDFQYHFFCVRCFCTSGSRIWVGYENGTVQVLDLEGNLLGGWVAHNSPVIKISVGAGFIFTLANHGGIRGWNILSPGPFDLILHAELTNREFLYTKLEHLKILTGTWNVGQGRASHESLIAWLGCSASDVDIVVVGLQEVEMGAGFLAMSAAKESVGIEGSSQGQWWLDMIGKILDEGSTFERIGSRQLAGLLVIAWVRINVRTHAGDVDAAAVPCGFGRAIGNKGAVGLRIRVYDRILCFVNCHFAAHLEAVGRRNDDFDHVYRTMVFSRPSNLIGTTAAAASSSVQMLRTTNAFGGHDAEQIPELSDADMVVFLGDLNYRLHGISYDEARDFISQRCFDWLRERDQLRAEMSMGNVFQGMREAEIRFPPTYKFEKHQPGLAGYDSGEKKRVPAWCDRIIYRDRCSSLKSECSLQCPVVSSVSQYDACMDVTDSDHKPVRCIFNIDVARIDESVKRQEFGDIIKSNGKIQSIFAELCKVPETIVSTNNIILQKRDSSVLRITNKCAEIEALFQVFCESQFTIEIDGQASNHLPRCSFGFPRWLEVMPAGGIIRPNCIMEVTVNHHDFQTLEESGDGVPANSRSEDNRDKEAILMVKIHGRHASSIFKTHRIRVRQCLLTKEPNSKTNHTSISQNTLHRSDLQNLSCAVDVSDRLRNLNIL